MINEMKLTLQNQGLSKEMINSAVSAFKNDNQEQINININHVIDVLKTRDEVKDISANNEIIDNKAPMDIKAEEIDVDGNVKQVEFIKDEHLVESKVEELNNNSK